MRRSPLNGIVAIRGEELTTGTGFVGGGMSSRSDIGGATDGTDDGGIEIVA